MLIVKRLERLFQVVEINVLEKLCGKKFWFSTQYGLESLAPNFNLFWRDVIVNDAKINEIPFTAPAEI